MSMLTLVILCILEQEQEQATKLLLIFNSTTNY